MFFAQVLACSTNNQYLCGWDASVRLWMQMLQAQTCRLFFENSLKMTFCMETNTKPLTEEDYYDSLRIKSEKDLLEPGKTEYDFIIPDMYGFEKGTDHLQRVAEFALDELRWSENTQRTFRTFSSISDILIPNLNEYIETLRHLHREVYKTIYGNYANEISELYNDKLSRPLSRLLEVTLCIKGQFLMPMMEGEAKHQALQRIIGHELECGWRRVTIFEWRQRKDRTAHENEADQRDIPDYRNIINFPDEWIDNMPDDSTKISALETIMSDLTLIAEAVGKIESIIYDICIVSRRREKSETFIIYSCMKKQYEEECQKGVLAEFSERHSRYRKDRQLPLDSQYLVRLLDETEQEFNQNDLCRMWHEWGSDIESFANGIAWQKQYEKTDFDLLFEYQAKCEMIKGMIADVRNREQGRDPLFAAWVDPIKLEEHLHFWIEAKVTTQAKWYVVWCLMKYTFGIIKPEAKKQDFVKRMGLMFPDAPKKCDYESVKRRESKKNQNYHFSKWLETDLDYAMAKDLYEKLRITKYYKREETDL